MWSSTSPNVNVGGTGLVRALVPGSSTVQASFSGDNTTISVLVKAPISRYAYASSVDGSISEYALNPATGEITTLGYLAQANEILNPPVVDSSGKYLYSATEAFSGLAVFSVGSDGLLTIVPGSPFVSPTGVQQGLISDPINNRLYGITQNGIISFGVTPTTGVPTPGATFPLTSIAALAIDPLGRFLYALQATNVAGSIFEFAINSDGSLNQVQGSPISVGTPAFGNAGFIIDPTGRFLYTLLPNGVMLFQINPQTGVLTSKGPAVPAGTSPTAIAVSPTGTELLVSDTVLSTTQIWAFKVSSATGTLSQVNGSPFSVNSPQTFPILRMSFEPSGNFAFLADSNFVETFSIDLSTGVLKSIKKTIAKENAALCIVPGSTSVSFTPRFAYTANESSASISAFGINGSSGVLTGLNNNTPYSVGTSADSISLAPSGLIVTDALAGNIEYFSLQSNGTISPLQSFPSSGFAITPGTSPTLTSHARVADN